MGNDYQCSCCGEFHEGLPLDYGAKFPDYYFEVPADERAERVRVNEDICVVDDEFYFIRGCVEIPILNSDEIFIWGAWCSLSEKSYNRVIDLWESEDVASETSFFGWINTSLPKSIYPETLNLKASMQLRNNNQRPFIELEPTDHPLAVEQRNGIDWERVQEFAEIILHGER